MIHDFIYNKISIQLKFQRYFQPLIESMEDLSQNELISFRLSQWSNPLEPSEIIIPDQPIKDQPNLTWFDKSPSGLKTAHGINIPDRLNAQKKLSEVYKKIIPSNALLARLLAIEEESIIFKNATTPSNYHNLYFTKFTQLQNQLKFLTEQTQ